MQYIGAKRDGIEGSTEQQAAGQDQEYDESSPLQHGTQGSQEAGHQECCELHHSRNLASQSQGRLLTKGLRAIGTPTQQGCSPPWLSTSLASFSCLTDTPSFDQLK